MDWRHHWNEAPKEHEETDFLRQVGKTVGGNPITPEQFDLLVEQLSAGLAIDESDRVLDLCCGNGLLTHRLASRCHEIVGVDYSQPLIEVAKAHHCPANARYLQASVLEIDRESLGSKEPFDKIYMYEALQHFNPIELDFLLERLELICRPGGRVYFGSVPDRARLWFFYDTPERRAEFERRVAAGTEAIGTWWDRDTVVGHAVAHGFDWQFIEQHPDLHTAHYRFDVLLTRCSI